MSEDQKSFNPCVIETELAVIIILLLVFLFKDCEFDFSNCFNDSNDSNDSKDSKDSKDSNKNNSSNKVW